MKHIPGCSYLITSIIAASFFFVPDTHYAQKYQTDDGYAQFHSSVPLHTFTGESDFLNGLIDFDQNLVDFYLDLSTLKTGNSRRDRDMYRTLNIDQYPFAEFTGSIISEYNPDLAEEQPVTVSGEFTLNGITVQKEFDGAIERNGRSIIVKAKWVQKLTDHQIEPPGILFYRVRDEMDIEIRAELLPVQKQSSN
jgi:polyisoprenoid-binding protein YceI